MQRDQTQHAQQPGAQVNRGPQSPWASSYFSSGHSHTHGVPSPLRCSMYLVLQNVPACVVSAPAINTRVLGLSSSAVVGRAAGNQQHHKSELEHTKASTSAAGATPDPTTAPAPTAPAVPAGHNAHRTPCDTPTDPPTVTQMCGQAKGMCPNFVPQQHNPTQARAGASSKPSCACLWPAWAPAPSQQHCRQLPGCRGVV